MQQGRPEMDEITPRALTASEIEYMGELLEDLTNLRDRLCSMAAQPPFSLNELDSGYRISAENLLHYLALRRQDIRLLQQRLVTLGFSSLGRSESCVLPTLDIIIRTLSLLLGQPLKADCGETSTITIQDGPLLLLQHSKELLGATPEARNVRIMVTMPTESAQDPSIIRDLLKVGMNCMRINCAHDDPETWLKMINNLQTAKEEFGQSCQVFMDLGGPKIRTGEIEPGPHVVHVHPKRNEYGITVFPARILLVPEGSSAPEISDNQTVFGVPKSFLQKLKRFDEIRLLDARHKSRKWTVVEVSDFGCRVESIKTCYVVPGTPLQLKEKQRPKITAKITSVPKQPGFIVLRQGDCLVVTADSNAGHSKHLDTQGNLVTPATISCTMPEVVSQVHPGESVWFDDGKIGGVIEKVETDRFWVKIQHARPEGSKLRAGKGMNLPDSQLNVSSLTPTDISHLTFIAKHADAVQMSFVNSAHDVTLLDEALSRVKGDHLGIVLKIETRRGFENLPSMLLTAMRRPKVGVMIARGNLAVECGYERLAEVQEEILSVCEAAHVPVIWATQVLENLAQKGMPSRAEISDAVMAHRAECVMLNKGPHVIEALGVLDSILKRMEQHQTKKRALLRALRLAQNGR